MLVERTAPTAQAIAPIGTATLKRILAAMAHALVRIEVSPMLFVLMLGPSPVGVPLEVDSRLCNDETRLTFHWPSGGERTLTLRWRPSHLQSRGSSLYT